MKRFLSILIVLLTSSLTFGQTPNSSLVPGKWKFQLIPNDSITIPFFVEIHVNKFNHYNFTIINGKENIEITSYKKKKDSLFIELPVFNSEFKIQILDEFNICGKWYNYAKGANYNIQLTGSQSNQDRFYFKETKKNYNFAGKYEVEFNTKKSPWKAVGLFEQKKNKVTGTFLTETGDYRFLEGNKA